MLDKNYENETSEEQRKVISSMYPEKLTLTVSYFELPDLTKPSS